MNEDAERVLILAPIGRDGPATAELLKRSDVASHVCADIEGLMAELPRGAAALFVAEEALSRGDLTPLTSWVTFQPPWSDLPVIVLTSRRQDRAVTTWRSDIVFNLGNVTLLERPVQPITLVSTVRAAMRARRRQYEVRDLLDMRDRAAGELSRKVTEATAELHEQMDRQARMQETLRQAQKMEAMGQLTGGVAHDFNNLLMVVSAGLDMLERTKTRERANMLFDSMRNAIQRGAGLTRQLLTFARRQPLQSEPINLASKLGKMQELLQRSLGTNLQLTMAFEDALWPVDVDPNELELTVLNLAFNSRDAMPDGGAIAVRAENVPAWRGGGDAKLAGDFVRLSVTDNGTGMSPEIKARVFEPFFTTKEVGKGSGLGLAQAYGFARGSGGLVEIESEVGKGTTIAIMLPRSAHAPMETPAQPSPEGVPPDTDRRSRHILVVEDDEEVAALVIEMLGSLGHTTMRVGSASSALGALANERRIDLVFSDVMMPGEMDGIALAREMSLRRPGLPILLTSGNPVANDLSHTELSVLAKPYTLDQLKSALGAAFK